MQVISVVRGLVKRGITICATIHCPPPHTFTLFDRALIMQRGRVVYFGLNGQPAIDYFYNHFDKVSSTCYFPPPSPVPLQCQVCCLLEPAVLQGTLTARHCQGRVILLMHMVHAIFFACGRCILL